MQPQAYGISVIRHETVGWKPYTLRHETVGWKPYTHRIEAERGFLARIEGGCQVPIGGHATVANGQVHLRALVASLRLDGRTIVVTRGAGAEDGLAARLRELGAEVREFPSIALAPPDDPAPLDEALRDLGRFAWVVFASGHAVEETVARLDQLGVGRGDLEDRRLACVGPATAERLAALLREPDLIPGQATGAALAESLARHVRGTRVLVPRAAGGRPELVEGLLAAGADVTAPIAYRTVPVAPGTLAPLGDLLDAGAVHAVAFASPSAVRSVFTGLGDRAPLLSRALLAAIGPTTAAALRALGLQVGAVPDCHTATDLADAIAAALQIDRVGPSL
jgi:uroporphyrinogen-III synthase/uroporphyrinogen III methyltransferase/synthase